jgi:hypothetical protein
MKIGLKTTEMTPKITRNPFEALIYQRNLR